MFDKRPIAVDWAVPKKLYNSGANAVLATEDGKSNSAFFWGHSFLFLVTCSPCSSLFLGKYLNIKN